MGRLTVRNFENEACCTHGGCDAYEDCYECPGFQDILAKLAHYEDLEESGRLVVLPDRKSRTLLSKALLNSDICPRNLGMEEIDPCTPDADCEACWEAALKGGGQDE